MEKRLHSVLILVLAVAAWAAFVVAVAVLGAGQAATLRA